MKCSKHLACYDESLVGHQKKGLLSWACQHTPIIKALRRLRPEEHKFETSLSDIVRPCLKKQKTKQNKTKIRGSCSAESSLIKPERH
jgi:hypothetical protein